MACAARRAMSRPRPVEPWSLSPRRSALLRVGDARPGVVDPDRHPAVPAGDAHLERGALRGVPEHVAEDRVERRGQLRPGHRHRDPQRARRPPGTAGSGRRPAPTRRPSGRGPPRWRRRRRPRARRDLRGDRLAGGVDQLVDLALEGDDGLPDAPDRRAAGPARPAENSPMLVSSGSSASASRRSTVSGVRSRCDRSATSSRSLVREVTSRSAIRLNAYPASASSRGPDGLDAHAQVAAADRHRRAAPGCGPRRPRRGPAGPPRSPSRSPGPSAMPSSDPPVAGGALAELGVAARRPRPPTVRSPTVHRLQPDHAAVDVDLDRLGALRGRGHLRRPAGAAARAGRSAAWTITVAAGRADRRLDALVGRRRRRARRPPWRLRARRRRHGLVPVVGAQLPAERDEEGQGGDGGGGGADVRQPRPQSGATNRNPTPRTVRR